MFGRLLILLALAMAMPAWAQQAGSTGEYGRYHALVIGNNDYQFLPRLRTAVTDAQGVADVLGQRYGFDVELRLNQTRDQMIRAISRYRELPEADNLVIYYAGHGIMDQASDRGFWLPIDAENDSETRWLDVAVISGNLRAMNARHVLVIADSCYSGTLTRSAGPGLRQTNDRAAWLKRMHERRARVALVSGGLEPVMDGGGSGHSVFARALINTLRDNRTILQGAELFEQLRGRVVVNSPQTPAYDDIRMAGHEGGDFLFVPLGFDTVEQQAPAPANASEAAMDLAFWDAIKNSSNPRDYQAYLQAFPYGRFVPLAKIRAGQTADVALARPEAVAQPPRPAQQPAPAPVATPTPAPRPAPAVSALPQTPAPSKPAPRPAAAPTPQQLASLPPPQKAIDLGPARGTVADKDDFKKQWSTIKTKLWLQYEKLWKSYDNAMSFDGTIGYEFISVDGKAIEFEFNYRATPPLPGARTENRTAIVRVRNTPDFEVLDWRKP